MISIKHALDKVIAATLLIMLSPIMLIIAVLVALDGSPCIYSHHRIGRRGIPFYCYKFRTMNRLVGLTPEQQAQLKRDGKLRDDPRVTRIGSFLRRTSLDELPQLYNVLRGDMSMVGPRPVTADELHLYGDARHHYLFVRPGITGLAQVSGRSNLTYDERIRLDTQYVNDMSLRNDLVIMIRTFTAVFTSRGAY